MKKLIYTVLASVAVFILASCGGGSGGAKVKSTLPDNEYLGNLPAIIDIYTQTKTLAKDEFDKKMEDVKTEKDVPKYEKYKAEYDQKRQENEKWKEEAIAKLKTELIGKDIPVVVEDPRYEVVELKIVDIDGAGLYTKGIIRTAQPIKKVVGQFVIMFEARDADNNPVGHKGAFSIRDTDSASKEVAVGAEFPIDVRVMATEPGAVNFAKMVFIPEK